MSKTPHFRIHSDGFTLTELAIVLVIVGLLVGGMLMPLSAQRDIRNISDTRKALAEINEALLGFAIINGRLPCPTTETDPANANYGIEDCVANLNKEGYLPWKSLGVSEVDAWGTKRSAQTDPFTGYWHYRVDSAFGVDSFTLNTDPLSLLMVQDAVGNKLTQVPNPPNPINTPVAVIYSTGPDLVANGQNAIVETPPIYQAGERSPAFDDVTLWIGRPILLNRLVTAGKLP